MKISIVVPVLNEEAGITSALTALGPLRHSGHEVIVVDGGSADETVARAMPLADRVLSSPAGRAAQMNLGAAAATGSVLLFLHADTRLPPSAAQQVAVVQSHRPGWGRFDVRLSGRQPLFRLIERMISLRSRCSGVATGDQAIFLRKACFEAVGGFPSLPLMEDVALSKRLLRARGRPLCIRDPVTTSSRRWEEGGVLRTVLLMWLLRGAYWLGADPARLAARYRAPAAHAARSD